MYLSERVYVVSLWTLKCLPSLLEFKFLSMSDCSFQLSIAMSVCFSVVDRRHRVTEHLWV